MAKVRNIKVLGLQQFDGANPEFYVRKLSEHLQTSHLHINKPHKHDFFATVLFTTGSGLHEIDFETFDVRPGSVFLLSPGQTHNWELSIDCEGIIFFHSQDFYDTHYLHETIREYSFFSFVQNRSAVFLNDAVKPEIQALFEKLLAVSKDDKPRKRQLVLSLITQVYIELERYAAPGELLTASEQKSYYEKFLKFEALVEAHFLSEKSAAAYANRMNITAKHLNRINRLIVGKTTSEIIADRVILEAKRMLIYAKENFLEVSEKLGFSDYAHFSKQFKAKTGLTPSAFSKKYD